MIQRVPVVRDFERTAGHNGWHNWCSRQGFSPKDVFFAEADGALVRVYRTPENSGLFYTAYRIKFKPATPSTKQLKDFL